MASPYSHDIGNITTINVSYTTRGTFVAVVNMTIDVVYNMAMAVAIVVCIAVAALLLLW